MKRILIAVILSAALLLTSCGDASALKDLPCAELAETALSLASNGDKLSAVGDSYITGMLELSLSAVTDYVFYVQSSGTEIDQIGIFKTSLPEQTSAELGAYQAKMISNWETFNYFPEEEGKLKNAVIKTEGQYVIFLMLKEEENVSVLDAILNAVKG